MVRARMVRVVLWLGLVWLG
uniref:Uncharacterized protein n=1 Tax=Anguilla anguilla TaxID=7936 RepID=A0A0E9QEB6_ANGAN